MKKIWTHKSKYKGKEFFGNSEFDKNGKKLFKLVDKKSGVEKKTYRSWQAAKFDGWVSG